MQIFLYFSKNFFMKNYEVHNDISAKYIFFEKIF